MFPTTEAGVSLKNILVATDFSSSSAAAVAYAIALSRRFESRLYFAHVVRPASLSNPTEHGGSMEQAWREGHHLTTDLLVAGQLRGVEHKLLIHQGEIWEQLAAMAEEYKIDMIVAGTHGRTGLKRMLLGSVAESIFRRAYCPVLTVSTGVSDEIKKEPEFHSVLYAVDFARCQPTAGHYAFLLSREYGASLTLVHVIQDTGEKGTSRAQKSEQLEAAKKRMRELAEGAGRGEHEPELVVGFGTPAVRILDVAAEKKADLIVLGVRQGSLDKERRVWATASEIVRQSSCPVLTVRETG